MVPNRSLPQASREEGCQGRRSTLPSIPLVCGMQAGPPHCSPHHPPPALWPCLGDLHELSFPAALRRSQPGERLPLPSHCLAVPREAGPQRGGGSLPASRPLSCPPTQAPLGFAAEAQAGTGGARLGPTGQAHPHCRSLVELPLTSGRRLPCLHGDQTVSAALG